MVVALNKLDFINMIRGTQPDYPLHDKYRTLGLGCFNDSYGHWDWNYDKSFDIFTEDELYAIYLEIINTK